MAEDYLGHDMPHPNSLVVSREPDYEDMNLFRRQTPRGRGLKRYKIGKSVRKELMNHLRAGSCGVRPYWSPISISWSLPSECGNQHTLAFLYRTSGGLWTASGWASEHLVCMNLGAQMPTLRGQRFLLKPRTCRIMMERGTRCHFCGFPMPLDDITIEHWHSKNLGGDSRFSNLRLAHQICNNRAGGASISEKEAFIRKLRREFTLRETIART